MTIGARSTTTSGEWNPTTESPSPPRRSPPTAPPSCSAGPSGGGPTFGTPRPLRFGLGRHPRQPQPEPARTRPRRIPCRPPRRAGGNRYRRTGDPRRCRPPRGPLRPTRRFHRLRAPLGPYRTGRCRRDRRVLGRSGAPRRDEAHSAQAGLRKPNRVPRRPVPRPGRWNPPRCIRSTTSDGHHRQLEEDPVASHSRSGAANRPSRRRTRRPGRPSIAPGFRRYHSVENARYWWTDRTAAEPSPTAEATRFMEPDRTSPTANRPGVAGFKR